MPVARTTAPAAGPWLANFRRARRLSQREVARRTGLTTKHISFVETGRANPSRHTVLALCEALEVPARRRNEVLMVAGFAPAFQDSALGEPALAPVIDAVKLLLAAHEPLAACVFDRNWDIAMVNAAYTEWLAPLWPEVARPLTLLEPRPNFLRMFFQRAARKVVHNWDAVAPCIFARASRELRDDPDPDRLALLDEITRAARPLRPSPTIQPIVPIELSVAGQPARFYHTIATLGTANDVNLRELRIEMFHCADRRTAELVRSAPVAPV